MDHKDYMRRALELAAQARAEGDVPVGCVIVGDRGDRGGGAQPPGGERRRHRPCGTGGHPGRLPPPGQLAAPPVYHVRHPGAMPHVRRRDHQRPGGHGALWDPG